LLHFCASVKQQLDKLLDVADPERLRQLDMAVLEA
jgi:hypothetical protein